MIDLASTLLRLASGSKEGIEVLLLVEYEGGAVSRTVRLQPPLGSDDTVHKLAFMLEDILLRETTWELNRALNK